MAPSGSTENSSKHYCEEANCAHFLKKGSLYFYRNKFMIAIGIGLLLIISWFCIAYFQYKHSLDSIVESHDAFCFRTEQSLERLQSSNDSTLAVNENILAHFEENKYAVTSLLEMQFNKLQSEYAVLTLWASALMIIFLIFSIYSMFKVDEMQKQGRDSLENIENFKDKAKDISTNLKNDYDGKIEELEEKSKQELNSIKKASDELLVQITTEINKLQSLFESSVEKKTKDFDDAINEYRKKLEESNQTTSSAIQSLIEAIKNSSSSSKEEKGE